MALYSKIQFRKTFMKQTSFTRAMLSQAGTFRTWCCAGWDPVTGRATHPGQNQPSQQRVWCRRCRIRSSTGPCSRRHGLFVEGYCFHRSCSKWEHVWGSWVEGKLGKPLARRQRPVGHARRWTWIRIAVCNPNQLLPSCLQDPCNGKEEPWLGLK